MIKYNKNNISLAKSLRKNMTPWEKKLWYQFLRNYPIRFQRQKAIGEYIVDFYCAKAKLVIEIDGKEHLEKEAYKSDSVRTKELEKLGLKIIRILNFDIYCQFENVCKHIDCEVKKSLPQSAALTAPSSEGAYIKRKEPFQCPKILR